MDPDQMREWAFKNKKYVMLKDGDQLVVKFVECKSVENKFDSEKESMRYSFQFEDGSIKFFENGSPALAEKMAELVGKTIKLTRHGEGNKTKYDVEEFKTAFEKQQEEGTFEEQG